MGEKFTDLTLQDFYHFVHRRANREFYEVIDRMDRFTEIIHKSINSLNKSKSEK